MAASAIVKMILNDSYTIYHILVFLGNPDIALTISVIIAIFTFGLNRGKSMKEVMESVDGAVKTIAMILLVVAGGGVLKQILIDSGLGTYIGTLIQDAALSPLFMGWLIAAVIRML